MGRSNVKGVFCRSKQRKSSLDGTHTIRMLSRFLRSRSDPFFYAEPGSFPSSILSALLLPALTIGGNPRHMDLTRPEMIVALPTFLFALKTKSLGGTVMAGMGLFWFIGKVTG